MARPQSFTADEVAQAAFDVARDDGITLRSGRRIAPGILI